MAFEKPWRASADMFVLSAGTIHEKLNGNKLKEKNAKRFITRK